MTYIPNDFTTQQTIGAYLSFDEIDAVNGGIAPLIGVAYVGIALSTAVLTAGTAFVAGAKTGHAVNKDSDGE